MNTLALILVTFLGYIVVYYTYGRFLSRKVFRLNRETVVPSRELEDGLDYVPTRKGVIFGHHYASIAGTGPIVGPAIGGLIIGQEVARAKGCRAIFVEKNAPSKISPSSMLYFCVSGSQKQFSLIRGLLYFVHLISKEVLV